jgi:drug/metabolite transporter (DMT)-like permease
MPIPHARRMNLIALALLITALIAFVAFHFLAVTIYTDPGLISKSQEFGWELWPALVDFLKDADFDELQGMVAASAFLTYCLLVVASPFITTILRKSRLIWWITVIASGVAMCGFGGMVLISDSDPSFSIPGPGLYCILASLALNFLGLLFIRREVPAAPEVDPA